MNATDKQRGIEDAARARAEVYQTLAQLQDNLNFAKRIDEAVDDTKARFAAQRETNPVAFFGGLAGVAAAVGVAVWGIATAIRRRFG